MKFKHTNRKGFWLGFIDFFTAGLFFLLYMPFGGLQDELEEVLGHKLVPYWKAYLLGIPTLFIYTLVWMSRIAEELKEKAVELDNLAQAIVDSMAEDSTDVGKPAA